MPTRKASNGRTLEHEKICKILARPARSEFRQTPAAARDTPGQAHRPSRIAQRENSRARPGPGQHAATAAGQRQDRPQAKRKPGEEQDEQGKTERAQPTRLELPSPALMHAQRALSLQGEAQPCTYAPPAIAGKVMHCKAREGEKREGRRYTRTRSARSATLPAFVSLSARLGPRMLWQY